MVKVILYSTKCPMCNVLEKKLIQKNITFEEINYVNIMKSKGILSVPVLEVNGNIMNFKEAVNWVNTL